MLPDRINEASDLEKQVVHPPRRATSLSSLHVRCLCSRWCESAGCVSTAEFVYLPPKRLPPSRPLCCECVNELFIWVTDSAWEAPRSTGHRCALTHTPKGLHQLFIPARKNSDTHTHTLITLLTSRSRYTQSMRQTEIMFFFSTKPLGSLAPKIQRSGRNLQIILNGCF